MVENNDGIADREALKRGVEKDIQDLENSGRGTREKAIIGHITRPLREALGHAALGNKQGVRESLDGADAELEVAESGIKKAVTEKYEAVKKKVRQLAL